MFFNLRLSNCIITTNKFIFFYKNLQNIVKSFFVFIILRLLKKILVAFKCTAANCATIVFRWQYHRVSHFVQFVPERMNGWMCPYLCMKWITETVSWSRIWRQTITRDSWNNVLHIILWRDKSTIPLRSYGCQ
jgi:hypothetical protein